MDILHIDKAAFDKLALQDKPVVRPLHEARQGFGGDRR